MLRAGKFLDEIHHRQLEAFPLVVRYALYIAGWLQPYEGGAFVLEERLAVISSRVRQFKRVWIDSPSKIEPQIVLKRP
jgi:hypothetical protein